MNHCCGIPNLQGNVASFEDQLTPQEKKALTDFRQRYYESSPPIGNDDDKEEKKDSSMMVPVYEFSHDELPSSGWRPLDDITLQRYLMADRRKDGTFDMEASYQRLMAALKFRKEHKVDVIVQNILSNHKDAIPDNVQKCQTMRVGLWAGTDRKARPVFFERLGQFFSCSTVTTVSQDEWKEADLYFLETQFVQIRQSASDNGVAVDRIIYFADLQGVVSGIVKGRIWKVVPLLKTLIKTVEIHYPEVVDHICLFNVPRIASAAYKMVRGFLDPTTAEKIELFAGVPLDRFKEFMEEDVIPQEYGGTNQLEYPQASSGV